MTARPIIDEAEAHFRSIMSLWVSWMHAKELPDAWADRDSVCGDALTNWMASIEDGRNNPAYENNELRIASIADACVESLMPSRRHAVKIHYGVSGGWLFKNLDQAHELHLGMSHLRKLIAKRC